MKTGTVTIRLPEEAIEQLQEKAKEKGCSLSDLLRQQILSGLNSQSGGGDRIIQRLEEMEKNLSEKQQSAAALSIAILRNTVGARYHASLATTYADDMITMMQTGNVLSEGEADRRQAVREKEAQRIEELTVAQAINSKPKGGRKVN